jgi:hypothetical protein
VVVLLCVYGLAWLLFGLLMVCVAVMLVATIVFVALLMLAVTGFGLAYERVSGQPQPWVHRAIDGARGLR